MLKIDWSQFIPDLIITVIGVIFASIFAGTIAYFESEKVRALFSKLPRKFERGFKWLFEKWYFFLPLCIIIILSVIAFRYYDDWKIAVISFISYTIGLLSWGLFNSRNILFGKYKTDQTEKTIFKTIPLLTGVGNAYLKNRYIDSPVGEVVLGGIQFQLPHDSLIFDTNEQIRNYLPRDGGGKEIDYKLAESVNGVKFVYFLINSGNSKNIYANQSIGEIRLVFRDAPPIVVELVLGKNIREWCPGNSGDFIREASSSELITGVWKGMSKNGANAVIDCLKIPVHECMRNCYLDKIIFVHKSILLPPETMAVHFSVFGIALEIQKVM